MVRSDNLRDDQYVLNHCAKSLARDVGPVSEPWRFPVIDTHYDDQDPDQGRGFNDVTFIYDGRTSAPESVGVVGTFAMAVDTASQITFQLGSNLDHLTCVVGGDDQIDSTKGFSLHH